MSMSIAQGQLAPMGAPQMMSLGGCPQQMSSQNQATIQNLLSGLLQTAASLIKMALQQSAGMQQGGMQPGGMPQGMPGMPGMGAPMGAPMMPGAGFMPGASPLNITINMPRPQGQQAPGGPAPGKPGQAGPTQGTQGTQGAGGPSKFASSEKDYSVKPSADETRPPGDNRTAEQIVNDNPVLKNLGNQKDIHRDNLKKQCGDWENDPDPKKRADAAYRVAHVLNYIDNTKTADGGDRKNTGDGNIQGITKDGDARHGTEAGMVKDFGEQGYGFLPEPDKNNLPTTTDTHVNADGSNQDEAEWAIKHPGEAIGHFTRFIGEKIQDGANWLKDHVPVLGKLLAAPLDLVGHGAQGAGNAVSTLATGGSLGDALGQFGKGIQQGVGSWLSDVGGGIQDIAGFADKVLGKIPGLGELAHLGNLAGQALGGGLNVAGTAVQGGDVGAAATKWGADVAGAGAEALVGLVDPTGIAAGAAGQLTTDGIMSAATGQQFDVGSSLLNSLDPTGGKITGAITGNA